MRRGSERTLLQEMGRSPMNFFAHASVASSYALHWRFILGAMLPDFLSILGKLQLAVKDPELARGVAFHHATDAAFHEVTDFVRLVSEARATLTAGGLGKGPARAAAHIGVEFLLDSVLSGDRTGRTAYLGALDHGTHAELGIAWTAVADEARLRGLLLKLREYGVPEEAPAPEAVARRIRRVLQNRPRLAFGEEHESAVADWVVRARPAVVGCAPSILDELRSRLSVAGFHPGPGHLHRG